MLCLSGFELYSRWVPLKQLRFLAHQVISTEQYFLIIFSR